jgi:hypothetical protein
MTGFALEWLRLRESFDAAARNEGLAADFAAAVRARAGRGRPVRVVDLGAGSGANFRFLAPLIGAAQDWTLVDDDEHLLAALADELATWRRRTGAGAGWRAAPKCLDLAAALDGLDLSRADGVATSALLDLVSVGWIESLAAALAREGLPFLAALSVDGRIDWDPAHPADGLIAAAFARDQHRDKGFGPALGPDAPDAAAAALEAHGYEVRLARSDWSIEASEAAMLRAMVDGIAAAAEEAAPAAIAGWRAQRREDIAASRLRLRVGHRDLAAKPR